MAQNLSEIEPHIKLRATAQQPFGSESSVREFSHEPATVLDSPLLSKIYDRGFTKSTHWSTQFAQVGRELDRLEEHWRTLSLENEVLDDLQTRASFLREAMDMAAQCDGVVDIS